MIFDCVVDKEENCFPMIPSGKAHNEMILPDGHRRLGIGPDLGNVIDEKGKAAGVMGAPSLLPREREKVALRSKVG